MTVLMSRRIRGVAFALGLFPGLALAESAPQSGRTWTDPPARGTAEARSDPVAVAPETGRRAEAAPAPARATRPVRSVARTPKRPRVYAEGRVEVARRSTVVSRRRAARVATPVAPRKFAARPVVRPLPPGFVRNGDISGYGYGDGSRAEATGAFVDGDDRARRIRQAQEAGYLVVRSRSVEFPDGRRLRTYRPIEDDSDD
ncbi:hypothetical protein [Methylobacterium sp. Leaf117]|uniref:hypothetical protein n=1 Tax=Methylobacterium sp. Leaf117 TaxID=1736260 RepID=UPI0006FFF7EF|nr:hypothetical protein [Methylobacterium sp. Leaf117]KQP92231.1 hypothetical protein ASF57_07240 [Methylobacterium sp. Leaf117]